MARLRNVEAALGINAGAGGFNNSPQQWVTVAATAALLDGALSIVVKAGQAGVRYYIRDIILHGGGTNFGAGGDRTLNLTDNTTVYTTVPNASLEAAPAVSVRWGATAIPFLTGVSNTKTVAGQNIVFKYAGGTTDHTTGSITFSVLLEKTT